MEVATESKETISLLGFSGWIKSNWHTAPSPEAMYQTLQFCLLWNLFETFACFNDANCTSVTNSVADLHSRGLLDLRQFDAARRFFHNRYVKEAGHDRRFG